MEQVSTVFHQVLSPIIITIIVIIIIIKEGVQKKASLQGLYY